SSSASSSASSSSSSSAAAAGSPPSLSSSSPSTLPMRPMFQGLPLSTLSGPALSMGMLGGSAALLRPGPVTSGSAGLPAPLLQYPGMFPTPEELKYLSMAQIQAANQAQLAGEVAKMKPPYLTRNYLELAMLVCNTFRGKLFPCPHCRYVTDRRNNLKRHVATMHQACDKQLECCGVTFSTKASLREHITIFHHNGYSCAYCGRRFCRKALLKRHLSVHSGQKDYTCPHCDYATSHKSNLERHKRIHARLHLMGASGLGDAGSHAELLYGDHDDISVENSPRAEDVGESSHSPGAGVRNLTRAFHMDTGPSAMTSLSLAGHRERYHLGLALNSDPLGMNKMELPEPSGEEEEEDCDVDIDDIDDDEVDNEESGYGVKEMRDSFPATPGQPINLMTGSAHHRWSRHPQPSQLDNVPINLVTDRNVRASVGNEDRVKGTLLVGTRQDDVRNTRNDGVMSPRSDASSK
ncbi:zinc finger protein 384-like, partial [Aplysia californica]|uniref:Zinc finger protein 384-like n=1 Tax=Aplysia californica TaxID=6500 RepID=A0ABM0KAY5_APLCA